MQRRCHGHTHRRFFILCVLFLGVVSLSAGPNNSYGKIELLRDAWGIPHVFSETDEGAMYGLGYATAQERGFQMTYALRVIQGRAAEVLGERSKPGRTETTLDHDRKMRTFGWERSAVRTAANLDKNTRRLLEAYCAGVNDSFKAQGESGDLHPLFEQYDMKPEPWRPADCLLSWWHLAQFFAGDGTRELITRRNQENPPEGRGLAPLPGKLWVDDATAVVQLQDVDAKWVRKVQQYPTKHGLVRERFGEEGAKFSHAWVVGGSRTTTGAPVLVSDPQTPVRNPPLWMEFHLCGKTIDARGVGIPGSPGLLIGFNAQVAWGLTALGADQADLFMLETSPQDPDQYRWDGKWRKMETRKERIRVRGGKDVELVVRETHLGPVATEFCFRQPGEPEVALKRVPLCETDRDTIQGVFEMMRARNGREFARGLANWRFPTANCVYADKTGLIGYSAVGAIPVRSRSASDFDGRYATMGTGASNDWQGFVPHELLPQVTNPRDGVLFSANHRPAASFYTIPMGLSTGSMGDTIRSWRLRELLQGTNKFTPEAALEMHYDTVNPARRDIVRLGLHIRSGQGGLSEDSLKALNVLEKWLEDGASSDLRKAGADLATRLSTFFRFVATPLAGKFGGGESGLARFLKDATARIAADGKVELEPDEVQFINATLAAAWSGGSGERPAAASSRGQQRGPRPPMLGWFESLDGFGSLDPRNDLPSSPIICLDGQTIHCQSSQSYTQYVPLEDADRAQSICPIGHSDRPGSDSRTSTSVLWGQGKLHPAPLTRPAVERITAHRLVLSR